MGSSRSSPAIMHRTQTSEKEPPLSHACVGFTGLETAIGATFDALPQLDSPPPSRTSRANPAALLRVLGGTLEPGSPADITGLYVQRPWTVDPQRFHSKGRVTPFAGMTFEVKPALTVVAGMVLMHDGELRPERLAAAADRRYRMSDARARLLLADGTWYEGGLGPDGISRGEAVFFTGMTGYEEALTDPSYAGQIARVLLPADRQLRHRRERAPAQDDLRCGCGLQTRQPPSKPLPQQRHVTAVARQQRRARDRRHRYQSAGHPIARSRHDARGPGGRRAGDRNAPRQRLRTT